MSFIPPLRIATIDDLVAYHYTLALHCLACDRWSEANLEGLQAAGGGRWSFVQMKFKCSDCGGKAAKQLRTPVPYRDGDSLYAPNPDWS